MAAASAPADFQAVPGVVVGVLLIVAALGWFSWKGRWIAKRTTLWLVVAAIAVIVICGYLGVEGGER
ncbi:hypothetical protein [Glycomyces sp. NPDC047010]|uniref:hypothetical protein n=1 Tax=Glycomyces sp. NPDC047010 TaxID=3155023 RepID=UPI0033CCE674